MTEASAPIILTEPRYSRSHSTYSGQLPQLVATEEAALIWETLFHFVEKLTDGIERAQHVTQTVFLQVLSDAQFGRYATDAGSDEELVTRLVSLVTEPAADPVGKPL